MNKQKAAQGGFVSHKTSSDQGTKIVHGDFAAPITSNGRCSTVKHDHASGHVVHNPCSGNFIGVTKERREASMEKTFKKYDKMLERLGH